MSTTTAKMDAAQVRAELKHRAQTEGLTTAYETSLAVCKDRTAPASAKAAAAGILVKLANLDGEDAEDGKEDYQLDGPALARRAAHLRAQSAAIEARLKSHHNGEDDEPDPDETAFN
jgi:hypothetical protein